MRATILPYRLLYLPRPLISMMAKGCIVIPVLPLRCFLFLLPNYIHVRQFHILTRGKYCNRNTPNPKYLPLLTSVGSKTQEVTLKTNMG